MDEAYPLAAAVASTSTRSAIAAKTTAETETEGRGQRAESRDQMPFANIKQRQRQQHEKSGRLASRRCTCAPPSSDANAPLVSLWRRVVREFLRIDICM